MSITTYPGAAFTAIAPGLESGLTLTFGVRRLLPDTVVLAPTGEGIVEVPLGDGTSNYEATRAMPADAVIGEYETIWPDVLVAQEPILVLAGFVPPLSDVALKVLARTRDRAGHTGQFTDQTPATVAQVERIIELTAMRVEALVGPNTAPDLMPLAREVVAAGVAAQIEISLAPESASSADSAYARLEKEYEDGLAVLLASATEDPGDTASGSASVQLESILGPDPGLTGDILSPGLPI